MKATNSDNNSTTNKTDDMNEPNDKMIYNEKQTNNDKNEQ